jgi:uncharacterized membrane protein
VKQKLILYIAIPYWRQESSAGMNRKEDDIRVKVIIAMLEEFPTLKKKIRGYLEDHATKLTNPA